MPHTTEMVPSSIRFSQCDIRISFTHGDMVHDIIDRIKDGILSLDAFLPMDVAFTRGKYFTGNNRTLYVCRVLECEGVISTIRVRVVKCNKIMRLMTTRNDGLSITMRNGGTVRPHSIQEFKMNSGQQWKEYSLDRDEAIHDSRIKRILARNEEEMRATTESSDSDSTSSLEEVTAKLDRQTLYEGRTMPTFSQDSRRVLQADKESDDEWQYVSPVTSTRRRDHPAVQERTSTGWETGLAVAAGVVTAVGIVASLFLSSRDSRR